MEMMSEWLLGLGMVYDGCEIKRSKTRLRCIEFAGEECILFMFGLLIGIGEICEECIDVFLVFCDVYVKYGYI